MNRFINGIQKEYEPVRYVNSFKGGFWREKKAIKQKKNMRENVVFLIISVQCAYEMCISVYVCGLFYPCSLSTVYEHTSQFHMPKTEQKQCPFPSIAI